jgi:hypothetical protein
MGVWQGVAMDSIKFHPGLPCPILLRPAGGSPLNRPYGCFWGGPPAERAAVFYPFGHPTPYVYGSWNPPSDVTEENWFEAMESRVDQFYDRLEKRHRNSVELHDVKRLLTLGKGLREARKCGCHD